MKTSTGRKRWFQEKGQRRRQRLGRWERGGKREGGGGVRFKMTLFPQFTRRIMIRG